MTESGFPQRISFWWLKDRLPNVASIDEYEQIVEELKRRGWRQLTPPSNFVGLLEALLPTPVQQEAVRRRNAGEVRIDMAVREQILAPVRPELRADVEAWENEYDRGQFDSETAEAAHSEEGAVLLKRLITPTTA